MAPSWLGDAVLALPALELLVDAGIRVEILARQGTTRLFADATPQAALHPTSATRRARRILDAWRLRSQHFDAALLLPPSFSAALLGWASGAPFRIGEATDGRAGLLTHALPPAGRGTHLALVYQRLAHAALDCLQVAHPPRHPEAAAARPPGLHALPRLRLRAEERAGAEVLLESRRIRSTARPVVVAPGAHYGAAKRYPAERFAGAARAIAARRQEPILLVGGPRDAAHTAAVRTHLPEAVDLAGSTTLGTLLGVLERACGVLANDSGVMHLAAALGAPVVGVFGSTNPHWTGPLGPRAAFVSNPVPCAPCYARTCEHDFECMLGLQSEAIVDTLFTLMPVDRHADASGLRI